MYISVIKARSISLVMAARVTITKNHTLFSSFLFSKNAQLLRIACFPTIKVTQKAKMQQLFYKKFYYFSEYF